MLGLSQVLKPIKWQDLLEEGKHSRNALRTGAKIHFREKIFWGLGALSDDGDGCECVGDSGNANGDCDKCSSCIRYFH